MMVCFASFIRVIQSVAVFDFLVASKKVISAYAKTDDLIEAFEIENCKDRGTEVRRRLRLTTHLIILKDYIRNII